jgi:hypothetical protein
VVELSDGTERGSRGTGGEARIKANVPASGETLVADVAWPIANCADAYHVALRKVRYEEFAAMRAALEAVGKPDASLPGGTVFPLSRGIGRDVAGAARSADAFAARQGVDEYYRTEEMRWLTGRLIGDISVYLGQDRYPGLCTGAPEWTGILEKYADRFTKRVEEIAALRAATEVAAMPLVAFAREDEPAESGNQAFGAEAAAEALLVMTGSAGVRSVHGAAVFEAAHGALDSAGDALAPDRRKALVEAFGALERLWYLELAERRAAAAADGFAETLQAIRSAHAATCTCDH